MSALWDMEETTMKRLGRLGCAGLFCLLVAACSSTGNGGGSDPATLPESVRQELRSAEAGKVRNFQDSKALESSLLELGARFDSEPSVADRLATKFPSAAAYVRLADLYVLSELGRVTVGSKVLLDAEILQAYAEQAVATAAPGEPGLNEVSEELVLGSVPPPSRNVSGSFFVISGDSSCTLNWSGDDTAGNVRTCSGTTRITGAWWYPFTVQADHISARTVATNLGGSLSDVGAHSYACPLVKCGVPSPRVTDERRASRDGASSATASLSLTSRSAGCPTCGGYSIITFHAVDIGSSRFRFQTSTVDPAQAGVDLNWIPYGQDYEVPWAYNGPSCSGTSGQWNGCRGTGCAPCSELVDGYSRYFENHPNCVRNPTCGGQYYQCNSQCPRPTEADR